MRSLNSLTMVLLAANLGLAACGPILLETRRHPVAVKTRSGSTDQRLESARFSATDDDPFALRVLKEIQRKKATVLPAKEFMDAVVPDRSSKTLVELGSEPARQRIRDSSLTHIILLEHRASGSEKHGRVTAIVSLLSLDQLDNADTLSFHAEGHRAGLSLPLPYIFLVFPYSDPDVLGSATAKIAETLSKTIAKSLNRPPRLTLLISDNLMDLIVDTRAIRTDADTPHPGDPVKRWKNPAGSYSDLMSDAREQGKWI